MWSRNDDTGEWTMMTLATNQVSSTGIPRGQVRSVAGHVDRVTGVHRVFAGTGRGAVFSGVYDSAVAGRVRWDTEPELPQLPTDVSGRVHSMAEANGVLYAAVASNGDSLDLIGACSSG